MLDIGATPSVGGGGSTERLVLTSTETLHVPRPRFVGPQGLELVLPGGLARDDDVLLDVGALEDVGGPRLGVRELVQVTLAFGDRRVALLRVLGRQQRAERVVSDFTRVANVDWALAWAFDFATPRVAAPLVDVLLAVTGGHPRLTEVLLAAVVPAPGARSGWLTERDFEQALQRAETRGSSSTKCSRTSTAIASRWRSWPRSTSPARQSA